MMADTIRKRRDAKAKPHLAQYAPVWLEKDQAGSDRDVIVFNVVFNHPMYGWVSRRYRYDSFNDVLYHQGQRTLTESEAMTIQEGEPYLDAVQSNVPNSYGG
jgi:hypothetical protein